MFLAETKIFTIPQLLVTESTRNYFLFQRWANLGSTYRRKVYAKIPCFPNYKQTYKYLILLIDNANSKHLNFKQSFQPFQQI